jgi:hypothetical protein
MQNHFTPFNRSARRPCSRTRAFTLVELLVSISVLVLLVGMVSQMMSMTGRIINASGKQLDLESQSRIVLDRIGNNISNMVMAQGVAPIVIKNTMDLPSGTSNDGFALLTNARPRDRSSAGVATKDIRMAIMGYRVNYTADALLGGKNSPELNWGDGTITWPTQNATQVKSDLVNATTAVVLDLQSAGSNQKMIDLQPIGAGIFRFELCFLLDDGTVVLDPPRDSNFAVPLPGATGTNTFAVAISKATSGDANKRFVKAFIVGIAGLDSKTLAQLTETQRKALPDTLSDPVQNAAPSTGLPNGNYQTPLQAWDFTSSAQNAKNLSDKLKNKSIPVAPVLNSLRLYQRYYYIDNAQ